VHDKDFSFNGPVWSVSVEAFLYGLFFVVCSLRWNRWWHLALFASIASLISQFADSTLCQGALSFFLGGLAYRLFVQIWRRGFSSLSIVALIFLTALMWLAIPFNIANDCIYHHYRDSHWWSTLLVAHKDVVGVILIKLTQNSYDLLLFPVTILTLAVCEAHCGTLGKRLSFLGDISYSTYLIHFPLQLVFFFVAQVLLIPSTAFYSPWSMLLFFAVLIPLGLGSYHFVERPCQRFLRNRLLQPRDSKRAVAAVPTPGA